MVDITIARQSVRLHMSMITQIKALFIDVVLSMLIIHLSRSTRFVGRFCQPCIDVMHINAF